MATLEERLASLKARPSRLQPVSAARQQRQPERFSPAPQEEETGENWLGIAIGVAAIIGAAFTGGASLTALGAATTTAATVQAGAALAGSVATAGTGAMNIEGSLNQNLGRLKQQGRFRPR